MRKILRAVLILLPVLLLASPVFAQSGKGKSPDQSVREMDFEGDLVEGQILRPDQGVGEAVLLDRGSSLIRVRKDFVDEILKSAEDL